MMYSIARVVVLAALATNLNACQRERHFHHNGVNVKRQVSERLPLSADEATITSSFDNNSISDWSYYYVSVLHREINRLLTPCPSCWRRVG